MQCILEKVGELQAYVLRVVVLDLGTNDIPATHLHRDMENPPSIAALSVLERSERLLRAMPTGEVSAMSLYH